MRQFMMIILTVLLGAGVQSIQAETMNSSGASVSLAMVSLVERTSVAIAAAQVTPTGCCNLNVGDRVRLLVDNPYDAPNLPAGWCGVVLCCDSDWPEPDQLLVSWDNWTEGLNDDGFCDQQPPAYTPNSSWWVACDQVVLDETCQPAPVCGNGVCEPGEDSTSCAEDCGQCCQLNAGDRVRLAADLVTDTGTLPAGACGFVVCCDPSDPDLPMFVSWDNWDGGTNSSDFCQGAPLPYPANSGYWVGCADLVKDATCETAPVCGDGICSVGETNATCPEDCAANCCDLKPGDAVRLLQDNPFNAPNLFAGTCGVVVCCDTDYLGPDSLLVSWSGWLEGINDEGNCTGAPWPYTMNSGWWVGCDQLVKDPTCPGCGDGVCTAPEDGATCPEDCDLCPNDPNKTEPGVCGCGTADVDANQNGTMDCLEGGGGGGGGRPRPTDTDGDGIADANDNCSEVDNPDQTDADSDGLGDDCDPCTTGGEADPDADGVCGDEDNCPEAANLDQADTDSDGIGDACDPCANGGETDLDADGVCGDEDNCPEVANPDQLDSVGDGVGDACRPTVEPPPDDSGQPRPVWPCARGTAEMMPFGLLGLFLMRMRRRRGLL